VAVKRKQSRRKIKKEVETPVLVLCRRRCCICYGLSRDTTIKTGQVAHLDRNRSNNNLDNLAYLGLYTSASALGADLEQAGGAASGNRALRGGARRRGSAVRAKRPIFTPGSVFSAWQLRRARSAWRIGMRRKTIRNSKNSRGNHVGRVLAEICP
jgi:hypothetical protein